MKYHRRIRWSDLFTTSTGLVRLFLVVLVCPALMLAAALASIVMTLVGSLSMLGLMARQPRAPWRAAGEMVGAVLARAIGRQGFTA
ncbi:hypothetical protein [Sphaerotilus sp.]|jgi:hypothetical protein|uniref:hypothetical protein n=1 Tax=Sphaerotilus sp. TaxID=2093942 RepID=UPI00286E5FE0|nr:hypothetical protein [Sphaerotilus sp.]